MPTRDSLRQCDEDKDKDHSPSAEEREEVYSATARTGLDREEQAAVGRACKRLIDAGRIALLRDMGFSVALKARSSPCLRCL